MKLSEIFLKGDVDMKLSEIFLKGDVDMKLSDPSFKETHVH